MKKIFLIGITTFLIFSFFTSCKKDDVIETSISVNAGLFQTISLPTDSATLTGTVTSGSSTGLVFSWKLVRGPNNPTIINGNASTTEVTNLVEGTYIFQFQATNSYGTVVGIDTTGIVVFPTPVTQKQLLTAHTWEVGETYQLVDGVYYYYKRGSSNNFPDIYNQDPIRYTFHDDGTGIYILPNTTSSTFTWEFDSADPSTMNFVFNFSPPANVYWHFTEITDSTFLFTSVDEDHNKFISYKFIPVP